MGAFLQTAILKDCPLAQAEACLERLGGGQNPHELIPGECRLEQQGGDVVVSFNEYCCGYAGLAEDLSVETGNPVLLLYIYDSDFWGYELYDKGKAVDSFCPIPDYFGEEGKEESCRGDSGVISRYFHVEEDEIKNYLVRWTEEMEDQKAYEDDECGYYDWQMVDFMRKLGYTCVE